MEIGGVIFLKGGRFKGRSGRFLDLVADGDVVKAKVLIGDEEVVEPFLNIDPKIDPEFLGGKPLLLFCLAEEIEDLVVLGRVMRRLGREGIL